MAKSTKRPKGTGTLLKRGGIYWWRPPMVDGVKGKPRSLETTNEAEAGELILELLPNRKLKQKNDVLIELAEAKNLYKDNRIKTGKAFERFIKHKKRRPCSEKTLKQKENYWNAFKASLPVGLETIDEISESHVVSFLDYLEKSRTPRIYNEHIKYLKNIFNVLKNGKDNPFFGFNTIEENPIKKKPFTAEILQKIFLAFDPVNFNQLPITEPERKYHKTKPPLYVQNKEEQEILHHIGPWTGQRLKDCVLQEWKYIDLERHIIRILPYKTLKKKKQRFPVPIHPDLYNSLLIALKWKEESSDYVLPKLAKRYNGSGTKTGVNKDCIKILKYISLETTIKVDGRERAANIYGFHSFRHAFAFFLLNAGVSYEIIEALIGTSAEVVRDHYSSFGMDKLKSAINALPGRKETLAIGQNHLAIDIVDKLQEARLTIMQEVNSIDNIDELEIIYKSLKAQAILNK